VNKSEGSLYNILRQSINFSENAIFTSKNITPYNFVMHFFFHIFFTRMIYLEYAKYMRTSSTLIM
jgi:hypothetical protein